METSSKLRRFFRKVDSESVFFRFLISLILNDIIKLHGFYVQLSLLWYISITNCVILKDIYLFFIFINPFIDFLAKKRHRTFLTSIFITGVTGNDRK